MNEFPIRIVSINMYEAPGYQEQYYRPFTTHAGDQTIVDELRELTHDGQNISAPLISNAASRFIRPQANVSGNAHIQNGWGEKRFVFTMQVECDVGFANHKVTQYISGFTDHLGVNQHTHSVNPQMRFYFNSVMSFRSIVQQTPGRGIQEHRALQHAAHVITPNSHLTRQPGQVINGYPNAAGFQNIDHMLRPQDLVNAWQTESIMGHAGNTYGGVSDHDLVDMSTAAAGAVSLSRFNNGHTPEYLTRVLGAMFGVQSQVENRQVGDTEQWSLLLGTVQEPSVAEFNILREFTTRMGYGSFGGEDFITWGDLLGAFGAFTDFDNITAVYFTGELMRQNAGNLHFGAENTEAMGGANNEVIMANMVVNSLPGILSRCALAEFAFTATNETMGSPEPYVVLPSGHPQTITQGANYQQLVQVALNAIKTEICPMISNGNSIPFFIQVHASLVRDTTVVVRIAGGVETPFTIPTWGSAIFTPVSHSSAENLQLMAHDIDNVYSNMAHHSQPIAHPGDTWAPHEGDYNNGQHFYNDMMSVSDNEPESPDGSVLPPHLMD